MTQYICGPFSFITQFTTCLQTYGRTAHRPEHSNERCIHEQETVFCETTQLVLLGLDATTVDQQGQGFLTAIYGLRLRVRPKNIKPESKTEVVACLALQAQSETTTLYLGFMLSFNNP